MPTSCMIPVIETVDDKAFAMLREELSEAKSKSFTGEIVLVLTVNQGGIQKRKITSSKTKHG